MISCVQCLLDDQGAGRGQWPGASGYLKPVHSPGAPAGVLLVWLKLLVNSTDSDHGVYFKLEVFP